MKYTLVILLLCISLSVSGATYYISPSGNDSNPGTLSQPFFTLNKAWSVVSAGDIVYMRGGTYSWGASVTTLNSKSGSSGNLIKISAYPNEQPVIDYSDVTFGRDVNAITITNSNYIHIKGIRFTHLEQEPGYDVGRGLLLRSGVSNCIFEQLEIDHIGGPGITIGDNSDNNLFLNCDSHHNADPYSPAPYDGGDGIQSGSETSTNNMIIGCRFWSNSDDGLDLRGTGGVYLIQNCWSFRNGYIPDTWTTGGNGDGFKLGGKWNAYPPTNDILKTITNSLAWDNRVTAFSPEQDYANSVQGVAMYNNTAFRNGEGFNCARDNPETDIVRNNIAYKNGSNWSYVSITVHDHNSFDIPIAVSEADFVSVDATGADGPRQSDGSLPDINFLKLAAGSDFIDAGVDVGLPYSGNTPDLGAFEFQTDSPPPSPMYISSEIKNSAPSVIEIWYDLILANIVPSASAFSVNVNSKARTINSVSISGKNVLLTLSSPVSSGDAVTVSYTKPATNPVQTASGGQAASISAQNVTNNVKVTPPPVVNQPPTVTISNPSKGNTYINPTDIEIEVIASDPDGTISKVELLMEL